MTRLELPPMPTSGRLGSGCYHDRVPASPGGHFVLIISCLLLGTVGGSFSPVVEDVVAKRCAFHALDDAACVEAGCDVAENVGVAGSPAVTDGVGVERRWVEAVPGAPEDDEALAMAAR
jgi:hypothetical protein